MKNILIFSQESFEYTVEAVIDWITHLGHKAIRLNGDNLENGISRILIREKNGIDLNIDSFGLSKSYHSIWYRRWSYRSLQKKLISKFKKDNTDLPLALSILSDMSVDQGTVSEAIIKNLKAKKRLTEFHQIQVNKIDVLLKAKKAKLLIPDFLLTNSKLDLQEFFSLHKKIITKDIDHFFLYESPEGVYLNYASLISVKDLNEFPDFFWPIFFSKIYRKTV